METLSQERSTIKQTAGIYAKKISTQNEGVSRFNATVEHLVKISPTFQGISASFLCSAIIKNEILRHQFKEGETIIREGDSKCDHFFALLSGELLVSKNGEILTSINQVSSFGSIGYFLGKRSADVIAAVDSTVLILRRQTTQKWPDSVQITLYENLARELSRIIENTNKIIAGDTLCTDKIHDIQEQLSNLGI